MSGEMIIILGIAAYILTIIAIIVALNFLSRKEKNSYHEEIVNLEREKNLIISGSIMSELNKVEPLVNNDVMRKKYDSFIERFNEIKEKDVAKITDELVLVEELYLNKDYKELVKKLNETELDIYYAKTKSNFLLEEIKEITLSEERNRETITNLKMLISFFQLLKYLWKKMPIKKLEKLLKLLMI